MTAPPPRASRLARYIALWVVLGVAALGVTLLAPAPDVPMPSWGLVVALGVATTVLCVVHVRVPVNGEMEASHPNELATVPLMLLVPAPVAVVVTVVSCTVAEGIRTGRQWHKVVFNVAWQVVAVAIGAWLRAALLGPTFTASPAGLLVGVLVAAAFIVVNGLAVSGIYATVSGRSLRGVLKDDATSSALVTAGSAILGVLVAVLIVTAPWGLPLLALLPLLDMERARTRQMGYTQIAAGRNRFKRTVDGSSSGIVLVDGNNRVDVWNPQMVELTGIERELATGARLIDLGLDHLVAPDDSGPGPYRLTLGDRVVEVRRTRLDADEDGAGDSVLSLQDVSREAELARIREDLVSRISHEIRTPLTTAKGFLELLGSRWDDLSEDQRRDMVDGARRGTQRLDGLVAKLLTWSQVEQRLDGSDDAAARPPEAVELAGLVDEVAGALDLDADVTCRGDLDARAWANPEDLRLVLGNLVQNAARYGRPPVDVEICANGANVRLTITDHGDGIPQHFAHSLFEPFRQASEGIQRDAVGMGLGLAIVESLVVANGGEVTYRPGADGGAGFQLTLPTPGG